LERTIHNIKFSVQFNITADNYDCKMRNQHTGKITNLDKTVTLHYLSDCNTKGVELLTYFWRCLLLRQYCIFSHTVIVIFGM